MANNIFSMNADIHVYDDLQSVIKSNDILRAEVKLYVSADKNGMLSNYENKKENLRRDSDVCVIFFF